jgi:hypothetical protein
MLLDFGGERDMSKLFCLLAPLPLIRQMPAEDLDRDPC